jgi:hypothetical protein
VVVNSKGRQLLRGVLHVEEGVREAPIHRNESGMKPERLLTEGERMAGRGDAVPVKGTVARRVRELHQDASVS